VKLIKIFSGVLAWWLLAPIALFLVATLVGLAWPLVVYLSTFWGLMIVLTIMVRMARWMVRPNFKS
jgi:hypothetical protein